MEKTPQSYCVSIRETMAYAGAGVNAECYLIRKFKKKKVVHTIDLRLDKLQSRLLKKSMRR